MSECVNECISEYYIIYKHVARLFIVQFEPRLHETGLEPLNWTLLNWQDAHLIIPYLTVRKEALTNVYNPTTTV